MQEHADAFRENLQDRIAFVSHGGKAEGTEIWLMQANGTPLKQLAAFPSHESTCFLSYSPDEAQIAFTAYRHGNYEIYVMDNDGSNERRLTYTRTTTYGAAWSPDGKRIAFTSCIPGTEEVYVINADGSHQERLTTTAYIEDGHPKAVNRNPAWSPDGQRIVFCSTRSGNFEIFVMNADGTNAQQLTESLESKDLPKWSPDGTQIAFMGSGGISVMDSTGNNLRQLTTSGLDFYPMWSPNGKYLAYASRVEVDMKVRPPTMGHSEIFAVRIEDAQSVRLTTTSINNTYPCWIH